MSAISLVNLCKEFESVTAVDDVNLEIEDGSFTVLLGPSGCGKTTTLNLVAGLEVLTRGSIAFDGQPIQTLQPHKRDVAVVFQSYALYPNRSVRDNIAFPLQMRRVDREEIRRRVDAVAAKLSITELLDRRPRALSGGQQQRVALARAIVRRPRAFLLDEPLSNLDAKLRADMRVELKSLQRDLGGTFLHVTHDQAEAMSLADNLVVMASGRVQQVGAPLDVYRKPANLFVATFVGVPTMNLVAGQITNGTFRTQRWSCDLGNVPSGDFTLGIRSEDLVLEAALEGGDGRVRFIEQLGADALVVVDAGFGQLVARAQPDTSLRVGDPVRLRIDPGRVHLFETSSGRRIASVARDRSRTSDQYA